MLRHGSCILLVVGGLGAIFSMVLHPTGGHGLGHGGDMEACASAARFSAAIHAIAVASMLIQVAGAFAVQRRLLRAPARADLGLVALAVAILFACLAATVNGLGAPRLVALYHAGDAASQASILTNWRLLHELADVATQVFFVGTAVTACAWGSAMLGAARDGAAPNNTRSVAWLGIVCGTLGLLAWAFGLVRAQAHPLMLYVLAFEIWIFALAWWLRSGDVNRSVDEPGSLVAE